MASAPVVRCTLVLSTRGALARLKHGCNRAGTPMSTDRTAPEVTRLLGAVERGESGAANDLMRELYGELRRLAAARLLRTPGGVHGQTLQPTALVHEAFARLLGKDGGAYENRRHFFFAAARAMQDIMVEQARRKARRAR